VCEGGSSHLQLKNLEGGLYSRNHPRVRERKAPVRVLAEGAAAIALDRAGIWGQRSQLLLNVGDYTNEHRLFDSVWYSKGLGQRTTLQAKPPKTTARCGCFLSAAGAKRRTPLAFEYGNLMRGLMDIAECRRLCE
jgi:hypothetical protein